MAFLSIGHSITEAWEAVMREHERRDALQISTLHDWKRTRGRWKDMGWARPRPSFWLLNAFRELPDTESR